MGCEPEGGAGVSKDARRFDPVVCSGCDAVLSTDEAVTTHHCYDEHGLPHFRHRMRPTADDFQRLVTHIRALHTGINHLETHVTYLEARLTEKRYGCCEEHE